MSTFANLTVDSTNGSIQNNGESLGGSSNFHSFSTNFFSGSMLKATQGQDKYVSGTLNNALNDLPFTISFWINPSNENYGDVCPVDIGGENVSIKFKIGNFNGVTDKYSLKIFLCVGNFGHLVPAIEISDAIQVFTWSHVLIERDSNNRLTTFINGVCANQSDAAININEKGVCLFKKLFYGEGEYFQGRITGFFISTDVWNLENFIPSAHLINNDPSMQLILNCTDSENLVTDSSSNNVELTNVGIIFSSVYPTVQVPTIPL
jgi:Concanavalin A-like lectin/glucanases superfamily